MLKPKCIHEGQCLGHSAQGYLTPCCFIDAYPLKIGNAKDIFYQEKFKISNNENIEDITQSREWIEFYMMLQEEPEKAPPVCHKMCSDNSVGDNYGH